MNRDTQFLMTQCELRYNADFHFAVDVNKNVQMKMNGVYHLSFDEC